MELEQTVGQQKEANWNWIQGEMEVFFSVWPSIVLDLHEINVDGSNITEFSNTLDESLINIKNKDKEKTAQSLAKLYNFLPDFINSTEMECIKKNSIDAKSKIINAYAYVESEDWEKVQTEVTNAGDKIMDIMDENACKEDDKRKYNINKVYILMEELKNSLSKKDKEIFHIKYKILLEELNTII